MGRANLNLVFALVWLVAGAIFLLQAWLDGKENSELIGWLALGMFGYNMVRWWYVRSASRPPPQVWRTPRRRPPAEGPLDNSFKLEDEPPAPETGSPPPP